MWPVEQKEEEAVRPSSEAEEPTPPPQQSTVVVSTLTLGSLSSGGAARGEDDPPPPEVPERAPVDRTESDDGEQAAPISPRGARKSRDMHNYENVEFSAAADDKAGDEQYPTNDDDEVLSCDSIEGDDHRVCSQRGATLAPRRFPTRRLSTSSLTRLLSHLTSNICISAKLHKSFV